MLINEIHRIFAVMIYNSKSNLLNYWFIYREIYQRKENYELQLCERFIINILEREHLELVLISLFYTYL